MKREIYHKLIEWKNSPNHKPLILYGARQTGKTYILKKFGNNEFKKLIYINCYKNEVIKAIFSQDINISRIVRELTALSDSDIVPGDTMLFFDEVQEIPEVVASLKYFCEDMPSLHVAVAGSLLGVINMKDCSFPVGKVEILHLYPMTFNEFAEAMGESRKLELLKDIEKSGTVDALAPFYIELLRQYYYVGGMPEAVKIYKDSHDTEKVREIQLNIISTYEADIAKHSGTDAYKIRMVWQSIPFQLARENKKFIYGAIRHGSRAAQYENAIQWLVDAGLVYKIDRITKAALPLKFYMDRQIFKLYLLDVGLLGALVGATASLVLGSNNIFSDYKGAFTENYVLSQIITLHNAVIGYFSKDNSTLEIDFLMQFLSNIFPIEVKAEQNVKSKSLRQFVTIDNGNRMKGIRASMQGYKDQEWMINVPLYAVLTFFKLL